MITKDAFRAVTDIVISKMEGGYYHPNMLLDGRVTDHRYANSGETMMGIDRKAGGSINTTEAGQSFWKVIDDAGAADNWKWNYMGGSLNSQLKGLASDVMYPSYVSNSKNYLSTKASAIVDSDPRLVFHFSYATWNGAGWFKKFAKDINDAVDSGTTNSDKLVQVAIDSRTKEGLSSGSSPNSLIKQGGDKIAGFIQTLGTGSKLSVFFLKKTWSKPMGKVAIIGTSILTIGLVAFLILVNSNRE